MTTLFAIWLTGALVFGFNLWAMDWVDFSQSREVLLVVALSAAWPLVLASELVERFQAWRNPFGPVLVLLMLPTGVWAQTPDHRGEVVADQPAYRGEQASAPIPPSQHVRNEGGSDGAGLCVISSILANGMYQKVPGLNIPGPKGPPTAEHPDGTPGQPGKGSALWRAAKASPGGYSPDKLAGLIQRVMPGEKYGQLIGTGTPADFEMLERMSKAGYPIGATMNTGALYNYQPIHHMVSLLHYRRGGLAMVADNNRPGFFSIMPSTEWDRRWPDMGVVWAWIWSRLPIAETFVRFGYEVGLSLLIVAGALFALGLAKHQAEECEPCSP